MVIDMGLPDSKGDALVREVRSIYPSLPIVIATGQGKGNVRNLFKGMVSIAIVNKPFTADELKCGDQNYWHPLCAQLSLTLEYP